MKINNLKVKSILSKGETDTVTYYNNANENKAFIGKDCISSYHRECNCLILDKDVSLGKHSRNLGYSIAEMRE